MFIVQTPDGSQMFVETLDGHGDCTVIASDVPEQPDPAAQWDSTAAAWVVPLATAQTRKRGQVDAYLYGQFLAGFQPTQGALAGHTLQCRDDTDRTNWLTSQAAYLAAINAGQSATLGANFRTADNITVTLSYQDGYSALLDMAAWGKALMGKSWQLKDAIDALTDSASVAAYDVAAQWAALP